jgi:hypothetical protein
MDNGAYRPGLKRTAGEADHPFTSGTKIMNAGSCSTTSAYILMASAVSNTHIGCPEQFWVKGTYNLRKMAYITRYMHQQGVLCFDHRKHLCVLYESQNRQRFFSVQH